MEKLVGLEGLEKLVERFQSISPLPQAFYLRMLPMLREEHLPKNTQLLKEGEVARRIYFIAAGLARAWYLDAEERECTCWFMREGDVMISVYSFFTGQPAHETIELIERTKVYSITEDQLNALYKEFPEFNLHGRILTQQYYIRSEARSIMLRNPKIKDRVELFERQEPDLNKRLSLPYIASYLGTTKETLSRLRNQSIAGIRRHKTDPLNFNAKML